MNARTQPAFQCGKCRRVYGTKHWAQVCCTESGKPEYAIGASAAGDALRAVRHHVVGLESQISELKKAIDALIGPDVE